MVLGVLMDQIIEIMAVYWVDWQQTAIANTRYSVVLGTVAFFIGMFFLAILKSGKIKSLQQQLLQNRQLLDETKNAHDKLVKEQAVNVAKITEQEQQLEKMAADLQQEKEAHKTEIANKDELFLKLSQEKNLEIEEANSKLIEKNQLSEKLQNELNEYKDNIAKFEEVRSQVTTLEKQLAESNAELNSVKSELESELKLKDTLLEKVDKQELSTKTQINRVLELEGQLLELNNTHKIETIQRQDEQVKQREQELLDLTQKQSVVREEAVEPVISTKVEKVIEQPEQQAITSAPIAEANKETVAPDEKEITKQGISAKVLGWFSSMDKALEGDDNPQVDKVCSADSLREPAEELTPVVSVEPVNVVKEVEPVVEVKQTITAKVKEASIVAQPPKESVEILDEEESSFSEKLAEVADKMDSMQGKLKGFFSKK